MSENDEFDSLSSSAVPGIDGPAADGKVLSGSPELLRAELEQAKAQAQEQRSLYLRALADFDNYKKRTDRMMRDQSDEGRRKLLARILPVLDNLERAAAYRRQGTNAEQLVEGLLATVKQFTSMLDAEGVRPIELVGKPFDPTLSEAVATREDPDAQPNTVLDEARKGYMIGGEVLRPAQVIVAKASE